MDGRTNRPTDRRQTDRCFQYTFTLTQNHEEIKNHPEHVSNIRSFFDLYNWAGIEYPTSINKNNYDLYEKNNPALYWCKSCD